MRKYVWLLMVVIIYVITLMLVNCFMPFHARSDEGNSTLELILQRLASQCDNPIVAYIPEKGAKISMHMARTSIDVKQVCQEVGLKFMRVDGIYVLARRQKAEEEVNRLERNEPFWRVRRLGNVAIYRFIMSLSNEQIKQAVKGSLNYKYLSGRQKDLLCGIAGVFGGVSASSYQNWLQRRGVAVNCRILPGYLIWIKDIKRGKYLDCSPVGAFE